jgi:hypothetical protein
VLAHPSRRKAWKLVERAWMNYLLGIEVWNRKTDGWAPSQAASQLIEGAPVVPFVGMDFHDRNQLFPLTMEIDASDSPLNEDVVLGSLRERRCRARALGVHLNRSFYRGAIPALNAVESGRRLLAQTYKRLRRRPQPSF